MAFFGLRAWPTPVSLPSTTWPFLSSSRLPDRQALVAFLHRLRPDLLPREQGPGHGCPQ